MEFMLTTQTNFHRMTLYLSYIFENIVHTTSDIWHSYEGFLYTSNFVIMLCEPCESVTSQIDISRSGQAPIDYEQPTTLPRILS